MITFERMNKLLPIVADSWKQLRKSDVYRLLNSIGSDLPASIEQAANVIHSQRPDLRDEIAECAVDIVGINAQVEPITLIRHVLGAEVYRDADGTEWYCRPNGDLVFNVAIRPVKS